MFMGFRVEKECCAPEPWSLEFMVNEYLKRPPAGDEFTAGNEFALKTTTRDDRGIRGPETAGVRVHDQQNSETVTPVGDERKMCLTNLLPRPF